MTLYQRWVCECCYLALATGDTSSCEHYYNHTEQDHPAGLLGEFDWVAVSLGEEVLEIPMRSYRECDGCGGTVLAMGTLYEVHYTL